MLRVYDQVVQVDLMLTRAKHSLWIEGTKPEFLEQKEGTKAVDLAGVIHPVLLEAALDSRGGSSDGNGAGNGALKGVTPVDISIPGKCRVLTISGPNTGGKTASIKTIALCLHMAKCGLYVRVAKGKRPRYARSK